MEILGSQEMKQLFSRLRDVAVDNKEQLIELDSVMGDGDMGLTMAAAFTAAADESDQYDEKDVGSMIIKAGMAMARAAPSTMGTLMGTGFMRGGKALKGQESIDGGSMVRFWESFVDGIMERGKARPGEKTIIDSIHPAMCTLQETIGEGLGTAMQKAREASIKGEEAARDMIAQHGRIAYYQEKSKGTRDPGAVMGTILFDAFADLVNSQP